MDREALIAHLRNKRKKGGPRIRRSYTPGDGGNESTILGPQAISVLEILYGLVEVSGEPSIPHQDLVTECTANGLTKSDNVSNVVSRATKELAEAGWVSIVETD